MLGMNVFGCYPCDVPNVMPRQWTDGQFLALLCVLRDALHVEDYPTHTRHPVRDTASLDPLSVDADDRPQIVYAVEAVGRLMLRRPLQRNLILRGPPLSTPVAGGG